MPIAGRRDAGVDTSPSYFLGDARADRSNVRQIEDTMVRHRRGRTRQPTDRQVAVVSPAPIHRTTAVTLTVVAALLVGLVTASPADGQELRTKVYNGIPADIADLPSVALLQLPDGTCTGTVIAADWVLTAAHCFVDGTDPADITVSVGGDELASGFAQHLLGRRVIVHPDYDVLTSEADVALLELAVPARVRPQALAAPAAPDPVGEIAVITGWGAIVNDPDQIPTDVLRRAEAPVLTDDVCAELYGDDYLPEAFVCAGGQDQDVCTGDSGGPLLITDTNGTLVQYGVVSYGERCGPSSSTIGVYVSVARYLPWISDTVRDGYAPGDAFVDVPPDSVHAAAIATVAAAGIATGYDDQTFRPAEAVRRGQMATFLAAALDLDTVAAPTAGYTDVAAGATHAGSINALSGVGLVGGFPDGTFGPDLEVTRGQMATFLAAALGFDPAAADVGGMSVRDVPEDSTHAPAIAAILHAEIATGFRDDTFRPSDAVTRGQMATFLTRGFGLESPS